MNSDISDQVVTPLFRKEWYSVPPSEPRPKPFPPLTHIDIRVSAGLDLHLIDKLNCASGAEVDNIVVLAERVINMLRARQGQDAVSLCTVSRAVSRADAHRPPTEPAGHTQADGEME